MGSIKTETVLARLKVGRKVICAGKGNVSPLIAIEAHFLEMILQLASMRQSLTAAGSLNLINSMIQSNNLQDEFAAWKKKHNISGENDYSQQLGQKYWQNFKKRHPEINIKKAIWFDSKWDDWCTYENFKEMYNGVYSAMVRSQVAIQVPNKVFVTLDGTIT